MALLCNRATFTESHHRINNSYFMSHFSRILFILFSLWTLSQSCRGQQVGLRTNVLYWATTTPNLGFDVRLGNRTSLSLSAGYNPFEFSSSTDASGNLRPRKLKHWLVVPEFKYWFCKSFEGHYLSVHALAGRYNAGGLLGGNFEKYRYKGSAYGLGLGWGHQWALGKRWGVEASLSLGYVYLRYDKYDCVSCGEHLGKYTRHYWGPTKAEVSFLYYLQ